VKFIWAVVFAALAMFPAAAEAESRIVIVVGPSSHPPGSHEVAAGGRLMQWALENMSNVSGVKAQVVYEWPKERAVLDAAGNSVKGQLAAAFLSRSLGLDLFVSEPVARS
jgi:hypothetical protein